jgi:hypothetical protein
VYPGRGEHSAPTLPPFMNAARFSLWKLARARSSRMSRCGSALAATISTVAAWTRPINRARSSPPPEPWRAPDRPPH